MPPKLKNGHKMNMIVLKKNVWFDVKSSEKLYGLEQNLMVWEQRSYGLRKSRVGKSVYWNSV